MISVKKYFSSIMFFSLLISSYVYGMDLQEKRKFICSFICGKNFATKYNQRQHEQHYCKNNPLRTKVKIDHTFFCTNCAKFINNNQSKHDQTLRHLKNTDSANLTPPLACSYQYFGCKSHFYQKGNQTQHEKYFCMFNPQSIPKYYHCDVCNKDVKNKISHLNSAQHVKNELNAENSMNLKNILN